MKRISSVLVAVLCIGIAAHADVSGPYTYTVSGGKATITDFSGTEAGPLVITNTLGGYQVVALGNEAFDYNSDMNDALLTSITVPEGVTSIAHRAISGYPSLTNISLPSTLTTLDIYAFYYNISLPSITIPRGVTAIPDNTFYLCVSLTNVSLPSTITRIGDSAFDGCIALPSIVVPASVTQLGSYVFYGCTNLHHVYFAGTAPSYGTSIFGGGTPATNYFLPNTGAWGSTFGSRPAKLWNPGLSAPTFNGGTISCSVTGTPPIP